MVGYVVHYATVYNQVACDVQFVCVSRDAISDTAPFPSTHHRNAQISIVNKHLSSLSLSSHFLPFNLSIYQPIPPIAPSITLSRSLLKGRRCSRLRINHPSTSAKSPNEYRCCPHLKGGFSSNLSFSPSPSFLGGKRAISLIALFTNQFNGVLLRE